MLFLQRCSWLNLINFSRKDSHWKWFVWASARPSPAVDCEAWSLSAYLRSSLSAFIVQKLYNSNWRASWVLSFMKRWEVFCFYNIPEIITDVALGAGGAAVAALFPKWITSQQVSSVKSKNDVIFCLKTSEITSMYWTCFLEYEDDPDWDKQRHLCPWIQTQAAYLLAINNLIIIISLLQILAPMSV